MKYKSGDRVVVIENPYSHMSKVASISYETWNKNIGEEFIVDYASKYVLNLIKFGQPGYYTILSSQLHCIAPVVDDAL